jgi:hypothetical protein
MKRVLQAAERGQNNETSNSLIGLNELSIEQQQKLAHLLWKSFHGSVDDLGETPEEMVQEVTDTLAGKYGEFLGQHSLAFSETPDAAYEGCVLVSLFRGIPLIIYVSVAPSARGKKRSTMIMKQVMRSLAVDYEAVYLVVTEVNLIAQRIYQQLGFVAVGSDWDTVLNET